MSKDVNNIGNRSSLQKAIKDVDKEYIKKTWQFTLAVNALNTGRIQSADEMTDRIQQLFDLCSKTGNVPSYESIAVACGIPIRTFYDMKKGDFEGYAQYSQIIKRAKDTITLMESSMVRDGKIPPSLWIFRAKNYLGMKDVQQIEAVVPNSGDVPSNKEDMLATLPDAPEVVETEKVE